MPHAVMIVPIVNENDAEVLGQLMGWGLENYTVGLTDRADGVINYRGLATNVSDSFIQMYQAAKNGVPPPGLPKEAIAVVPLVIVDFDTVQKYSTAKEHFDDIISARGLRRV